MQPGAGNFGKEILRQDRLRRGSGGNNDICVNQGVLQLAPGDGAASGVSSYFLAFS